MTAVVNRFVFFVMLILSGPLWAGSKENASELSINTQATLETVKIKGKKGSDQIEFDLISQTLNLVPGGTNLIDLSQKTASQSSLAKVLNYEPGIVVQEFFGGNDQPRINIRGSGIQDNPVNRGIQLLYDGLPLNQADGSFIIGLLDSEQARYISIYRGSNAMRYGATTLGGAINLHIKNSDNAGDSFQLENGSFGLKKVSTSVSGDVSQLGYFLQAGHIEQQGFRSNSSGERENVSLNIKRQWANWSNQTYLNFTDNQFDMPFVLTKQQAIDNPDSVMGENDTPMDELLNISIRKPQRDTQQFRIANQSYLYHLNKSHKFGFYADQTHDYFRNPLTITTTDHENIGIDYAFDYNYLGESYLETNVSFFVTANKGYMPRQFESIHPNTGETLQEFARLDLQADNHIIGGQISQELDQNWLALVSVQWVQNTRVISDEKNPGILDSEFNYSIINPKIGLLFNLDEQQRYYANISASSEAPNFWQLATVEANPHDPLNDYLFINDLKIQTANTFEVGMQFNGTELKSQFSYYYSNVKDELISVVGDFAVNGKTVNYNGDSIHQGIEVGLKYQLQNLFRSGNTFNSNLIYNYSDFRFANASYAGNSIAGVPEHLVQLELGYQPNRSWIFESNFRWQPNSTWVDHANTSDLTQDAFLLIGLKTQYQPQRSLKLFIELNNITDQAYQTAYVVRGQGAEDLPTFIPGAGFNFNTGLAIQW